MSGRGGTSRYERASYALLATPPHRLTISGALNPNAGQRIHQVDERTVHTYAS